MADRHHKDNKRVWVVEGVRRVRKRIRREQPIGVEEMVAPPPTEEEDAAPVPPPIAEGRLLFPTAKPKFFYI